MRPALRLILIVLSTVLSACTTAPPAAFTAHQVLFVCEHGNVKSLMAASYFNELAQARGLPFRAVSRGSTPDSDTVPDFVKQPLIAEGFDVSGFRPHVATQDDIAASDHVISISTTLQVDDASAAKVEQWNDIPAASTDFAQSRSAIKTRVAELIQKLEQGRR
jgi:arsenate reductase (thioredoxin)